MDIKSWNESLVLIVGAVTSAFAVVRLGMAQQRSLLERLMAFLQTHAERQSTSGDRLARAVEGLSERLADNTLAVARLIDQTHSGHP